MKARAAAWNMLVVPVATAVVMAWPAGLAEPPLPVPVALGTPVLVRAPAGPPLPAPVAGPVAVAVTRPQPPARKVAPPPVRRALRPRPAQTTAPKPRPRRPRVAPRRRTPVVAQRRVETLSARGARLLGSVRYDWRSLGFRVEFRPYTGRYLGLTYPDQKLIVIFVKPSQSDSAVLHVLGHELGHAVDLALNDDARRREYRRLRGLDAASEWFPCGYCADYASPAGDFAEVFEYWLLGGGDFESRLAGPPTRDELARMRALFHASPVAAASPAG